MATLGFVGLGEMGGPMATHLVEAGNDVLVYDLDAAAVERAADAGATPCDSAASVGERTDVLFLSLPGPDAVEAVVGELAPVLESGSVVVDTTTSTPETTRTQASRLDESDVSVLGAPVSGGTDGARDGTLTVMVGGDEAVFEAVSPFMDAFAGNVFFVGSDPGHGHAVKLLNNFLSISALLATSEAVALGQNLGLDVETMCDIFSVSTGRNSATEHKFPEYVVPGEKLGFTLDLTDKDIRLLTTMGEQQGMPLLLANVARSQVGYARNRLGGDADMIELFDYVRAMMGGDATDSTE